VPRHSETARLKAMLAAEARISWSISHARRQATERQVPMIVAERIVRMGTVTGLEVEVSGQERWRVSGRDPDGRPVDVVVAPIDDENVLRVITVIRTDE
jgi:hypothetical protein